MAGRRAAQWLMLILALAAGCASSARKDLAARAQAESLDPVRPGPPFWNRAARQFIHAPAFEIPEIEGAHHYRFIVVSPADGRGRSFDADQPTATLAPVWQQLPVGITSVAVDAIDAHGRVIRSAGVATFHRAAVFGADAYPPRAIGYGTSAHIALDGIMHEPFVRRWLETGRPDETYALYRYASKIVGSLMSGCAMYSRQTPRPADAEEAIRIGRKAADWLISVSAPAGTPLEHLPPTYHGAKPTERENDAWTMMMTPAEAGGGYLDLHDVTKDAKYLDAARRIAATYAKLQNPAGTWHLKVNNQTGDVVAKIDLIPAVIITFLDRLVTGYGSDEFAPTRDRAIQWVMDNPVRTFDWKAQFDDAKVRGAYENLAKHEACEFAAYLLRTAGTDREKVRVGLELLRFAEDQFVTWSRPPETKPRAKNLSAEFWITPCSTEQYAMFEPISGSSAFMIVAYLRAYEATGDPMHLAKARALGDALTVAQKIHGGRYPTRMVKEDLAYWVNSSINTVRAMKMLASFEGR